MAQTMTLADYEKMFGSDHFNVADVRNDLATLYMKKMVWRTRCRWCSNPWQAPV